MGAHRQGAQYTANCVYNDTNVNVKMSVNAQNDFCADFLVFHAISLCSEAVGSPNHAEGQDTQGAEQSSYQVTCSRPGIADMSAAIGRQFNAKA
jgi:hypothetical protein